MTGVTKCKCGADIIFLRTKEGRQMPTNYTGAEKPGDAFDLKIHTSHFSACRHASEFRKRK